MIVQSIVSAWLVLRHFTSVKSLGPDTVPHGVHQRNMVFALVVVEHNRAPSVNSYVHLTGGLRLPLAINILCRGLAVSAKNSASLSNVDRSLAAAAATTNGLSQSDTATGILTVTLLL